MDSLLNKIVNTLTGDKVAQSGKDYWVDDSKVKACYECETPFSVFVRRHHCRICGRIFCSNCTINSIPAPRDAADQQWLRACNYCHRMRQRDDDSSERGHSATAEHSLLGSVQAANSALRARQDEITSNGASGQTSPTKARIAGSLARSSASSEGALTWEVPAVLDRSFGPSIEAVAETAPPAAAAAAATPASAAQAVPAAPAYPGAAGATAGLPTATAADVAAASPANGPANGVTLSANSSINAASPTPASSSGLHPLVQLNRQELAVAAEEHLQLLLWQLLQAEEVKQADVWLPIVLRLVTEASKALLPAAAAAFGQQDPRFYVKVKRLPDMGRPSDSRVVRGVVAKKNVAHRRMRTDLKQPCVALLSGALEYQRVANKLSSFDTLLDQEREHLRLAVARIAAAKPDLLMVERSVARSAQEELLARGISLVQHTKPELLERLGRCMGVKVAASVEELSPQLVGTCSRVRVEPLPAATAPPAPQPPQQQQSPAGSADTAAAGSSTATANGGSGVDLTTAAATATAAPGSNSSISSILQPPTAPNIPRPGVAKPLPVSAIPAAAKTLMIFDGCPLPLGCTVLLWGASAAELTKLKRIVKFGVLAAYHSGLECAFLAEELVLGTAALATPGMTRDASLVRSIARAAISSSKDATNPEHLAHSSRLLLSLSPHVVVPDALEKEQQHEAAVRLHQQRHGTAALDQQQQQPQDGLEEPQLEYQQHKERWPLANGSIDHLQDSVAAITGASKAAAAAVAAGPASAVEATAAEAEAVAAAAESDEAPGTPGSSATLATEQQYAHEFTDPLRRVTHHDEDDLMSDDEGGAVVAAAAAVGSEAVLQVAPLWSQGLQLYDRQHVYLSMACRNPRRGLMCEPPAIKRIDYYCHSDLSLAAFIVAAAPHAQKKCQQPGCGDGVTCHVRTFLHAGSRITLSIATLPANEALPGEDRGQVWMWMRPKGSRQQAGSTNQAGVRRLPLSQACACMSFGMFLSLCFSAPGLTVLGTPLHAGFVRYFGLGRSVMCLHQDSIYPSSVAVPRMKISYSLNAQLMWLKQEAAELCQESNEAFDVLETALQSHPYFRTQAAAAQPPATSPLAAAAPAAAAILSSSTPRAASTSSELSPDMSAAAAAGDDLETDTDAADPVETAAAAADAVLAASSAPSAPVAAAAQITAAAAAAAAGGGSGSGSASKGSNGPLVSLSAMVSALRKDRSSFMDRVNEVVQRATPATPPREELTGGHSIGGNSHIMWDEQLMSGVLELNHLQRSLAITTLTWAATLQEPALFTQMLAASSTAAGPAAMAAAAAATASAMAASGSPLAAAAAAVLAEQGSGGVHGGSMFHLPPAVAAQRMGISDGSEVGEHSVGTSGVSVPIMTNAAGPIAVQAVANLVASQAAATTAAGGLLEGSQQVMMAVAQKAGSVASHMDSGPYSGDGSTRVGSLDDAAWAAAAAGARGESNRTRLGQHVRSSSVGSPRSPRSRWAAATAAATQANNGGRLFTGSASMGARVGSTGSLPSLAAAAAVDASIYSSALGSRLGSSNGAINSSSPRRTAESSGTAAAAVGPREALSPGSPSASLPSSSIQSRQQQQALHKRAVSTTGSVATAPASTAAANSADDASSDDGEVSHDRFVAWMTSHEIATPETDDMSDFYPEQLPDWDDNVGSIGLAAAIPPDLAAAPIAVPAAPAAAADRTGGSSLRPPTPPGTPDLGVRADTAATAAAPAAAAPAAPGSTPPVSHRRTGSTDSAAQPSDRPSQQQLQSSSGVPAGLPPIKTTSATAAAASRNSNSVSGTVGLQQIARVALPGRSLMPAGINDAVIPIFDAEPTSIAAYFLSSRAYQLQLNASMKQILHGEQRSSTQQGRQQQTGAGSSSSDGPSSSAAAAAAGYQPLPSAAIPIVNQHGRSISQDYTASRGASITASSPDEYHTSAPAAAKQTDRATAGRVTDGDPLGAVAAAGGGGTGQQDRSASDAPSNNGSAAASMRQQQQQRGGQNAAVRSSNNPKQPDWLALLLSPDPLHVKHAFDDDSPGMPWLRAKFSVTAYFTPQFAELRRRCIAGGEAAYITSLCRCRKWASRGGKSNAYFAKTRDDRFIVKSLSKPEKASFLEFAPAYFQHMAHAAASGKPTALAKVAGVYSITIKSQSGNPLGGQGPGGQAGGPYKDGSIDVLVMENIFYDRQITRIYDLKGSERSRFNADAAANPQDVGAVHLDDNLRRANLQQPILVDQGMLRAMERALWSDTSFLAGLGVMDYSLLVGVDREHNQLVVAIIDFIRTYTWDKQLETWVKSSGILGGNGKEPTIISPKQYMRRFRTAISSYFTVVPDGYEVEAPMDADAA